MVKDKDWIFKELENPIAAIRLLCKKNIFDYSELLTVQFSSEELALLKKLIGNQSIFIDFFPYRLCAEYSLEAVIPAHDELSKGHGSIHPSNSSKELAV